MDKNQPAFPIYNKEFIRENDQSTGLTKLEYATIEIAKSMIYGKGEFDPKLLAEKALECAKNILDLFEDNK